MGNIKKDYRRALLNVKGDVKAKALRVEAKRRGITVAQLIIEQMR